MIQRLYMFLRYYFTLVGVSVAGRLLFLTVNGAGYDVKAGDWLDVVWHGLPLDLCMSGYLSVLPLLFFAFMHAGSAVVKGYNALVALLLSVAIIVDAFLYSFWGFKLDATVLNYIDHPAQALASVSAWYVVLRCIAIVAVSAGIYFMLPCRALKVKRNPWMLLLLAPMFVIIRGGVSESTANVGMVYFSDKQFLNHAAVPPMFSFVSSVGKIEKYSEQFDFFDEAQRKEIFDKLYPEIQAGNSTDCVLDVSRPNVLIVIMEGFGANLVEATGGLKNVAPHLTAMADEGLLFSQCYAGSFRTDRGVVCILSGFPGQPTTSVMKLADRCGNMPSIAKSLKNEGYDTEFIYGGDINFTNMKGYLLSTGYNRLVAKEDFSISEQRSNAWGAQDEYTVEKVIGEITAKTKSNAPWLLTYLTLSSHEPFEVPRKIIADDEVLNSFAYTDRCIGRLISALKADKVWDNLLVVLLPDHGIRGVKALGNIGQYSPDYYHIPMIWTGGALRDEAKGRKMSKMVCQTDLAATLLSQMNIGHDDFSFSRNVLSDGYGYPFVFSSFNNGFVFRDSTGVTIFDNEADKITTDSPSPSVERLKCGRAVLQTVYDKLDELGER